MLLVQSYNNLGSKTKKHGMCCLKNFKSQASNILEAFQCVDGFHRVGSLEHIAAGDENVGSRFRQGGSGHFVDTSVDLYQCVRAACLDKSAQTADLVQRVFNECLSAESRIDRHNEHEVEFRNDVLKHENRCGGI